MRHVTTGTECRTGAGDHDGACVVVGFEQPPRTNDGVVHVIVYGVIPIRRIQGEYSHRVMGLDQKVRHQLRVVRHYILSGGVVKPELTASGRSAPSVSRRSEERRAGQ